MQGFVFNIFIKRTLPNYSIFNKHTQSSSETTPDFCYPEGFKWTDLPVGFKWTDLPVDFLYCWLPVLQATNFLVASLMNLM